MRLLVLAGIMQIRYELFGKDHRSPAAAGSLGAWKWRVLEVLGKVKYIGQILGFSSKPCLMKLEGTIRNRGTWNILKHVGVSIEKIRA